MYRNSPPGDTGFLEYNQGRSQTWHTPARERVSEKMAPIDKEKTHREGMKKKIMQKEKLKNKKKDAMSWL